ncbi:hypothetical protein BG006_005819 [Podila minutissima]|uniref:Uncharacterized protein n=1 Tax=Podila minutissima TaxID=64525 RepID=A0A9P5SNY3_9FUNG|nr:hypothetical protein BG006_005819 [Podila minutissima]
MKYLVSILSALAVCANAAHYIIDVQHWPGGDISFRGNLRYTENPYSFEYKDCKADAGSLVLRGQRGSVSMCPESKYPAMGLYFPSGFNGTIDEAYDYHNKLFYPCLKLSEGDNMSSYACAYISMLDFQPNNPTM